MKIIMTYKCEFCGATSEFPRKIKECEAAHLGVSVDEIIEWHRLNRAFAESAAMEHICKNEATSADVDAAYNALAEFEREHGLEGKDIPRW